MKIFLIGFMGSGKTHWGRLISQKLAIPFFDLDEQIIEQAGKSIVEIFEEEGEEQFRLREKDVLHIITESHDGFVMATGGGSPCYFNNIDYMNQAGTTVWINTPLDIIFTRLLGEKDKRPLIKSLSDDQLKNFIAKKFAGRRMYYEQADVTVDEDKLQLEQIIEKYYMHKNYLATAAIFGGLAVVLGAFGAHGLEGLTKDEKILHGFQTAVQYQMYHTLALLSVAMLHEKLSARWLNWAANCFITGIILFSGSLYLLTFLKLQGSTAIKFVGPITPLGGIFFIAGWLFLLLAAKKK